MDPFSICLNALCLVLQSCMQIHFCGGLARKRPRAKVYVVYTLLFCGLDWLAVRLSLPWIVTIGAEMSMLYGADRLALGSCRSEAWVAAILANYIVQFSFGLVDSIESVFFPYLVGTPLLYLLVVAAAGIAFGICAVCYTTVVRVLSPQDLRQSGTAAYLLFPALFFLAAQAYILQTAYTYAATSRVLFWENAGRHTALLLLQGLGLGALFCTLYAYRRLCHGLQAQAQARSLAQAARAQKVYIAEAQMRYAQTRAFRHDIKNHLSVLHGLLADGDLAASAAYLQKLDATAATLSFPYQTGNPVVDILLGEKLALAQRDGVRVEVTLVLPDPCGIDDFDLCVLFANALDNAIHACQAVEGPKDICVSGQRQGDLYLLAFENTCADCPLPPAGTGLSNIRAVAEKYHGAMLTEKTGCRFSLHVLLNIS